MWLGGTTRVPPSHTVLFRVGVGSRKHAEAAITFGRTS